MYNVTTNPKPNPDPNPNLNPNPNHVVIALIQFCL